MLELKFHRTANDFVSSLIRQRRYLIVTGKSKADPGFINCCLWELEKYFNAYNYDTDLKMAHFWVNHSEEIAALIPGRTCPVHQIAMRNYYELDRIAKAINLSADPLKPLRETCNN